MQELRFVAVSEDGRYAVLAVPGRSARFTLPIDERLRAVALGQTSRLVQYEIEVESPLRPKEIQARIRAGETGEEIVAERLKEFGSDPEDAQWDAKKRGDGSWLVELAFITGGRLHVAEWVFDPRRRHVLPADDNAARMSLPGGEPPQPATPPPGEATVTQLAPRLSTASGQGLDQSGTGTSGFGPAGPGHGAPGNGGRPRHERAGPARPPLSEPAPPPAPAAAAPDARGDDPHLPAAERHSVSEPSPQEAPFVRAESERNGPPAASERPDESAIASRPAEAPVPEPPAAAPPPVTPAAIAAQVPTAVRAPQPTSAGTPQPAAEEPRPATAVPAARPEPAASGGSEPADPADPPRGQARRPARQAAPNKTDSLPSLGEGLFGH